MVIDDYIQLIKPSDGRKERRFQIEDILHEYKWIAKTENIPIIRSKLAKKLNPDWCRFNIFIAYPDNILYQEIMKKHLYDKIDDFIVYIKTKDFSIEKRTFF